MSYATLQADVSSYLHRVDLTDKIPGFIRLAEANLARELSIRENETSVTGVTVNGYADLPADFGNLTKVTIDEAGSVRILNYAQLPIDTAQSYSYTLENGKLRIYGPDQAYTLHYIPTLTNLSDAITTNWLLTHAPDLYLYAAALEGAKYIRDESEMAKLAGMLPSLIDSVRRLSERKAQPSGGILQIKPRVRYDR